MLRGVAFHKRLLQGLDETQMGHRLEFFPLLASECIRSEYINEKRLKGGTPNVVPQTYQIELCPFRTITIMEINHTAWQQREDHVKLGGSLATFVPPIPQAMEEEEVEADGATRPATPAKKSNRNAAGDEESDQTLLGVWAGWQPPRQATDGDGPSVPFHTMTYENGHKCADGIGTVGIHRHADVSVVCGLRERIRGLTAVEDVCHYKLILETPQACSKKESKRLRDSLE